MLRPLSIRKPILRLRSKKVDYGPNATSLLEIVIPADLQLTYDGELFVYGDTGPSD